MIHTRTNIFQSLILLCMLISAPTIVCAQHSPQSETRTTRSLGNGRGALWRDTPQPIDTSAKYLFYLHGRIIEEEGVKAVSQVFGAYEYEQILQTFVDKDFIVISEPRPKGTDVQQYAAKVAGQINSLVQAGVPPQKITVVGASKGGSIAVASSSQLKNRDINFALIGACGNSDMYGNVLSVWDYLDDTGAAMCGKYFAQAKGLNRHKEVELRVGLGHGILYRPLKEWVDLVIEWANHL